MKIAVLSESAADEAAVKLLVDGILGVESELYSSPSLRRRNNWHSAIELAPVILNGLYFNTDVEALAIVVDSDDSPVHQRSSHSTDPVRTCRLCAIGASIAAAQSRLPRLQHREPVMTAVGLAVPAIEAWYMCGRDGRVNEPTWNRKLEHGEQIGYDRKSLKEVVYGPARIVTVPVAVREARRISSNIGLLEQLFPNGFGAFADDVRNWGGSSPSA
jgi:hypothetical protein